MEGLKAVGWLVWLINQIGDCVFCAAIQEKRIYKAKVEAEWDIVRFID